MILKLKNFQQELSSNLQYLDNKKPKEEQKRSTDRANNFSLANTPRKFSDHKLVSPAGSNLEIAKYAMLPKRSENNYKKLEDFPKFTSMESEESVAMSPSFALHNLRQETNTVPTESKNSPQIGAANFKSFLSSNSGKSVPSPHHENLSTDPNQVDSQNQSLRTTFLKDSVILQPSNNKLPECSPNNSTISSSSKSQNHLQEKSNDILSLLLNQSQSVKTPAKKVNNNTTLDSNFQDSVVELSSSTSLAENTNQPRQSDFLSKMKSLSQEILTPEKITPKKTDPPQSSQSRSGLDPIVAKLQFNPFENEKKILSETSSLTGLISALEAKEAREAKMKVHPQKSSNPASTPVKEDETFNQIIQELSPSSSIITPSKKRGGKVAEVDKHHQDMVVFSNQDISQNISQPNNHQVMKIQVELLQKVQQLKRTTKLLNKYNGLTDAFSQIKNHTHYQAPLKIEEIPSSQRSPIGRIHHHSLDLSPNTPNSYGFALGLDKISETDSMAASGRNRGSQAFFTGRSTPVSQNYSNPFMQQRIPSALQIEKVLSNCLRRMYHVFFNNLADDTLEEEEEILSPLHSESPHNENQGTARSNLSVSNNALSTKPLNNLHFIKIQEGGIHSDSTRDKSGNSTLRFGETGLKSSARGSDSVRGMRTVRFYEDVNKISDTHEESESQISPELHEEKDEKTQRQSYNKSAIQFHNDDEHHQDEESFDYSPARTYQANLDELEKRLEIFFENKIISKIEEKFNNRKLDQNFEHHLIKLLTQGLESLKPLILANANNDQQATLTFATPALPLAANADAEIPSSLIQNNGLIVRERRARSVESPHHQVALTEEEPIIIHQQIENPFEQQEEVISPTILENRRSPVAADDDHGLEFGSNQEIFTTQQDERIARAGRVSSPKGSRRNIQFYSPQPTRTRVDSTEGFPSARSHFMMRDKFTTSPGYTRKDFKDQDLHSSMAQDKSKLLSLALEKGVGQISRKIMFFFVFDKIMTRVVNDQRWSCLRKLKQIRAPSPTRLNRFQQDLIQDNAQLSDNTSIDEIQDPNLARSLYMGRLMERLFLERMKYGFYKVNMHYLRLKYPDSDKKKLLYSLVS